MTSKEMYCNRRATVGRDENGRHWSVAYYSGGEKKFYLDFSRWDAALTMALRWVGLEP